MEIHFFFVGILLLLVVVLLCWICRAARTSPGNLQTVSELLDTIRLSQGRHRRGRWQRTADTGHDASEFTVGGGQWHVVTLR